MKKDGGPAFPSTADSLKRMQGDYHSGMSLRQWYAGMALQGILAAKTSMAEDYNPWLGNEPDDLKHNRECLQTVAEFCFAQADAIIAEEEKE